MPTALAVLDAQRALDASASYNAFHRLAFSQRVEDGFFDAGRQGGLGGSQGDQADALALPALRVLLSQRWDGRAREVLLVDRSCDPHLVAFEAEVFDALLPLETERERCMALAALVAARMGGPATGDLYAAMTVELADLRARPGGGNNVVPIGMVRKGVCRHRALLFKAVADALPLGMSVRAGLARGRYEGEDGLDGPHAWNVCLPGAGPRAGGMLLDLLHRPGELYERGSDEERRYGRVRYSPRCEQLVWAEGAVASNSARTVASEPVWKNDRDGAGDGSLSFHGHGARDVEGARARPLTGVFEALRALERECTAPWPVPRRELREQMQDVAQLEAAADKELEEEAGGAEAARGTVEAWLTAGGVDPHKHAANKLDDGADWLRSSWRRLTSDRRANAAGLTKS